jgi:hypothetical protein
VADFQALLAWQEQTEPLLEGGDAMQIIARSEVPPKVPFIHFGYLSAGDAIRSVQENPVYGLVSGAILLFSAIILFVSFRLAKSRRRKRDRHLINANMEVDPDPANDIPKKNSAVQ